jgi:hypothetical protein
MVIVRYKAVALRWVYVSQYLQSACFLFVEDLRSRSLAMVIACYKAVALRWVYVSQYLPSAVLVLSTDSHLIVQELNSHVTTRKSD